jgi:ER membrane protein complex subunit 3
MMQGIQHFFSGFILLRVPFPLTVGFKNMFQRGIADIELEPAYTSSVSWYFLVMYGLRSFFKLAFGILPSQEQREQDIWLHKIGLQNPINPAAGKKQDAETMATMLRQEADSLEMFPLFRSEIDTVEKRLLGKHRYPKKKLATSADAEFLLGGGKKKSSKAASKKKQ